MRHWSEAAGTTTAHRLLIEAIRVSSSIPDETEKATAFLFLSINCDQVDDSRKSELLLSSIKSLNGSNKPTSPRRFAPCHRRLGYRSRVKGGGQPFAALTVGSRAVGKH
jgi:hypothetical protein